MREWFGCVWMWLKSYPRPWRMVHIKGSVLSGGTLEVQDGMTVIVDGDVRIPKGKWYTIKAGLRSDLTVYGDVW